MQPDDPVVMMCRSGPLVTATGSTLRSGAAAPGFECSAGLAAATCAGVRGTALSCVKATGSSVRQHGRPWYRRRLFREY